MIVRNNDVKLDDLGKGVSTQATSTGYKYNDG